jgi:L-rhamnose mutarotase
MEIYLRGTRLVMIMEVTPGFSFEAKAAADRANPAVQAWETLMWTFQQALPDAPPGTKWQPMERIFSLPAS